MRSSFLSQMVKDLQHYLSQVVGIKIEGVFAASGEAYDPGTPQGKHPSNVVNPSIDNYLMGGESRLSIPSSQLLHVSKPLKLPSLIQERT